jgi:hypothetical protein
LDRLKIEKLIRRYADVLLDAETATEQSGGPYSGHRATASRILARWEGGESESALREALRVELRLYGSESLTGRKAYEVGKAFGDLCRALDVHQ